MEAIKKMLTLKLKPINIEVIHTPYFKHGGYKVIFTYGTDNLKIKINRFYNSFETIDDLDYSVNIYNYKNKIVTYYSTLMNNKVYSYMGTDSLLE